MAGTSAKTAMIRSVVFTFLVMGFFIYISEVVTGISGAGRQNTTVTGVSVDSGESIFFGRGKCSTCHSIGERGSAIRCPNLGVVDFPYTLGLPIAQRAVERAKERTKQTGQTYTAVDYIVESHYDPSAYVVQGFKNEMPIVWQPPIALSADDEISVDLFLMSIGGQPDAAAIQNSRIFGIMKKALASQSEEPAVVLTSFQPYLQGDPAEGEKIFFDPESKTPCAKCHTVKGRGGKVGPDLSNVGGTRTAQYILDSILDPSKDIAGGYESYLIVTNDGEFITGVKKNEDAASVEILEASGELKKLKKSDIKKMAQQKISIMPGNFRDLLTVKDLHDLMAFLLSLS
jgi:putative heme-binding domain-containing protein